MNAFKSLIFLCLLIFSAPNLQAEICIWTGAVNNLWSDAGNWSCAAVPGYEDDVILNSSDVEINELRKIKSLTVSGTTNLSGSGQLKMLNLTVENQAQFTLMIETEAVETAYIGDGNFNIYAKLTSLGNAEIEADATIVIYSSQENGALYIPENSQITLNGHGKIINTNNSNSGFFLEGELTKKGSGNFLFFGKISVTNAYIDILEGSISLRTAQSLFVETKIVIADNAILRLPYAVYFDGCKIVGDKIVAEDACGARFRNNTLIAVNLLEMTSGLVYFETGATLQNTDLVMDVDPSSFIQVARLYAYTPLKFKNGFLGRKGEIDGNQEVTILEEFIWSAGDISTVVNSVGTANIIDNTATVEERTSNLHISGSAMCNLINDKIGYIRVRSTGHLTINAENETSISFLHNFGTVTKAGAADLILTGGMINTETGLVNGVGNIITQSIGNSGIIAPGNPHGELQVETDNFFIEEFGRLDIELTESGGVLIQDALKVIGTIYLIQQCKLLVETSGNIPDGVYTIVESTEGIIGTFASEALPLGYDIEYTNNKINLIVNTTCLNDTEKPSIACPDDFNYLVPGGASNADLTLLIPEATDNCGVEVLEFRYRQVDEDNNNIGSWSSWLPSTNNVINVPIDTRWKIRWRAFDAAGNKKGCRQFIEIFGNPEPVLSVGVDNQNFSNEIDKEVSLKTNPSSNQPDIQVFPNPVQDELTVRLNQRSNQSTIEKVVLFNQLGKVCQEFDALDYEMKIDMSALSSGTYFLTLYFSNGEKSVEKITKFDR